jgi:hypothetical protein
MMTDRERETERLLSCGHSSHWQAYRNPVDPRSGRHCLFCEVERLRWIVNDVAVGRRKVAWGWDAEKKCMGYWLLPPSGRLSDVKGPSKPTAIEAIEAEEGEE